MFVLHFWLHRWFAVHYVEDEAARKDSRYHLKSINAETRGILDELDSTYSAPVCMPLLLLPINVSLMQSSVVSHFKLLNYLQHLKCSKYC